MTDYKLRNRIYLAEKIRDLISKNGMKQADVCKGLGLSPSRLSNYLSGSREPDLDTLSRLARFLGVGLCSFDTTARTVKESQCPLCGNGLMEIDVQVRSIYMQKELIASVRADISLLRHSESSGRFSMLSDRQTFKKISELALTERELFYSELEELGYLSDDV